MKAHQIIGILAFWHALTPCIPAAGPTIAVDRRAAGAADGKDFVFTLKLAQPRNVSLKIIDADGRFVRALVHKHLVDKQLQVKWNLRDSSNEPVPAGAYTALFESGLTLKFDKTFAKEGVLEDKAFVKPACLRTDKLGNLYLLDIATSMLFKFTPEGAPADDFNGKPTLSAPSAPFWGGLAVEPDGSRIYLSESFTTTHVIDVYDPKKAERVCYIGGFFGQDAEWQKEKGGIAYPIWLGLNADAKLYSDNPGYARIWTFDRRKKDKPAGVWQLGGKFTPRQGWHSPGDCGDTDGTRAIYLASAEYHQRGQLFKIVDHGDSGSFAYDITKYADPRSKKEVALKNIFAVAYDGQKGIYVIERDPMRILLFADSDTGFDFVAALGSRGKSIARLEFNAPAAAAVSPDGKLLYVVDGAPQDKTATPAGQPRVARFKIGHVERKTLKLSVTAAK